MGNKKVTKKVGTGRGKPAPRAPKTAPVAPFRLEVGKTYETVNGYLRVKITSRAAGSYCPMRGEVLKGWCGFPCWDESGIYAPPDHTTNRDLTREVPKPKASPTKGRGPLPKRTQGRAER